MGNKLCWMLIKCCIFCWTLKKKNVESVNFTQIFILSCLYCCCIFLWLVWRQRIHSQNLWLCSVFLFLFLPVPWYPRSNDFVWSWIKMGSVWCLYTPVSPSVPEMEGVYATGGASFWGDGPQAEFMYLVFSCMPGESYHRQLGSLTFCLCVMAFKLWWTPLFFLLFTVWFKQFICWLKNLMFGQIMPL